MSEMGDTIPTLAVRFNHNGQEIVCWSSDQSSRPEKRYEHEKKKAVRVSSKVQGPIMAVRSNHNFRLSSSENAWKKVQ
jgi:hypothetical protein